jgi:hypothetical protein
MAMPAGHLQSQMTYGAPQQGGMWYPHPYMMVGMPPYMFGGQPMVPDTPAPDPMLSQAPQPAPAVPLPYMETRAPQGAPVEPMHSTERERCTELRTRHRRDPSIEQLRDTAARSCPAPSHSSSQDEEIDHLCKEVKRLQRDRLSIQHEADCVRLKRDHLRERLDLAEEQLSSRCPQHREEPRVGYHPYPRPFARSSRDPSPPSLTTSD